MPIRPAVPPELPEEALSPPQSASAQRIKLTFGEAYGLEILYTGPTGTGIRMRLPPA